MAITKKQIELDQMKWEVSQKEGRDACGSFDFCVKCYKTLENPCHRAYTRYYKNLASAKQKTTKKVIKK